MRLEYGVNVGGTESFRFAMNKSPFGRGCNAQTLPKELRYYLVPPPGRVFVEGDLSQVEARTVAYLSRCKDLIELFNDPTRHAHSENAIAVFGHPVEKDSPEYVLAKQLVHASHYREGPWKFAVSTGLPMPVARRMMATYHAKRPEIHRWHDWVWEKVKSTGKLSTPLGDTRTFYEAIACFSMTGKMTDQQWKDAIAWVPQTITPHLTNLGILAMDKELGDSVWWHHQGHDSFLLSTEVENVEKVAGIAVSCFRIPLCVWGVEFTVPLELSVGWSSGDGMPYTGGRVTQRQWNNYVAKKLATRSREERILQGTYGVHLKDWRP